LSRCKGTISKREIPRPREPGGAYSLRAKKKIKGNIFKGGESMGWKWGNDSGTLLILAVLVLVLFTGGFFLLRETSKAFGGNFAPMAQQQYARYQIAGRDGNSAWVIDTSIGDIFLIYADGRWKDVGSIFDEKKRIRK
jgi:hypothetical protein